MAQEDKELLLKDLCARLPYGVKVCIKLPNHQKKAFEEQIGDLKEFTKYGGYLVNSKGIDYRSFNLDIKPYLRPMSSMTDEEREEWTDLFLISVVTELEQYSDDEAEDIAPKLYASSHVKSLNWLNKHHFDYNGLIEKGLAIEVTAENNPYK